MFKFFSQKFSPNLLHVTDYQMFSLRFEPQLIV